MSLKEDIERVRLIKVLLIIIIYHIKSPWSKISDPEYETKSPFDIIEKYTQLRIRMLPSVMIKIMLSISEVKGLHMHRNKK